MSEFGMTLYIALCSLDGLMGGCPLGIIVEARIGSLVGVNDALFWLIGE